MSRDGCVALPCGAMVCLRFVNVVFPDHTIFAFVFLVSRDGCVALPCGAMGLSAVCERGFS